MPIKRKKKKVKQDAQKDIKQEVTSVSDILLSSDLEEAQFEELYSESQVFRNWFNIKTEHQDEAFNKLTDEWNTLNQNFEEAKEEVNKLVARRNDELKEKSKLLDQLKQKDEQIKALQSKQKEKKVLPSKKEPSKTTLKYKKKRGGKGLQTKTPDELILQMQDYANEILSEKGDFYQKIADKFSVSIRTAYKYCKEIKTTGGK